MNFFTSSLFLDFVHNIGTLALVVLAYGSLLRHVEGKVRDGFVALLFAVGVFLAMLQPLNISAGITVDARGVFIALSGLLGGWPAILASLSTGIAIRMHDGGVGAVPGSFAMLVPALASAAYIHWLPNERSRYQFRNLAMLGLAGAGMLSGMLFLPPDIALKVLASAGLPTAAFTWLGIVLFGRCLGRELFRHENNAAMRMEASIDPLTGLANRRRFDQAAQREFRQWRENGGDFSFVLIDVDHFKRINDIWGHAAGDAVLKRLAEIITANTRARDTSCRFGGEEIAVLMPRTRPASAMVVAERIRAAIEAESFDFGGMPMRITASFGIATADDATDDFRVLFDAADRALYAAKKEGRNCVREATAEIRAA